MVKEEADAYEHPGGPDAEWTVSDKRIMTTHIVGRAWERYTREKMDLVQKAFRDTGIFIPCDGSRDNLINIKGFSKNELIVGTYIKEDPVYNAHHQMPVKDNRQEEFNLESTEAIPYQRLTNVALVQMLKDMDIKGYSGKKKS